jgi:hypothetical protein
MSIILWCDAAMVVLADLARDQSVAHSLIHPPPVLAPPRAASSKLNSKVAGTPFRSEPVKMPALLRNNVAELTRELDAGSRSAANDAI